MIIVNIEGFIKNIIDAGIGSEVFSKLFVDDKIKSVIGIFVIISYAVIGGSG